VKLVVVIACSRGSVESSECKQGNFYYISDVLLTFNASAYVCRNMLIHASQSAAYQSKHW